MKPTIFWRQQCCSWLSCTMQCIEASIEFIYTYMYLYKYNYKFTANIVNPEARRMFSAVVNIWSQIKLYNGRTCGASYCACMRSVESSWIHSWRNGANRVTWSCRADGSSGLNYWHSWSLWNQLSQPALCTQHNSITSSFYNGHSELQWWIQPTSIQLFKLYSQCTPINPSWAVSNAIKLCT